MFISKMSRLFTFHIYPFEDNTLTIAKRPESEDPGPVYQRGIDQLTSR